jgi:prepilin-type N-terminal cleavage/methylation domain-containing protein
MTKNKKGFTIIEVVLVLAIAGLIFLMVFIALPALQRSQRNTRRRQDMARILSAFTEYASNNGGKVPGLTSTTADTEMNNFVNKYVNGTGTQNAKDATACVGDQFCDPDGTPYTIKAPGNGALDWSSDKSWPNGHEIAYQTKAVCDSGSEGKTKEASGSREIAIMYVLEGGAVYCGDNQ